MATSTATSAVRCAPPKSPAPETPRPSPSPASEEPHSSPRTPKTTEKNTLAVLLDAAQRPSEMIALVRYRRKAERARAELLKDVAVMDAITRCRATTTTIIPSSAASLERRLLPQPSTTTSPNIPNQHQHPTMPLPPPPPSHPEPNLHQHHDSPGVSHNANGTSNHHPHPHPHAPIQSNLASSPTTALRLGTPSRDPGPWQYAYSALAAVSRSFALVIMELQPELRHPIAIFYLVLRALDTIEDDTSVDPAQRAHLCRHFYTFLDAPFEEHASSTPSAVDTDTDADDMNSPAQPKSRDWFRTSEFGKGDEKLLLERFPDVLTCYASLKPELRAVIRDITKRMGSGMADHIHDVECVTIKDYDLYCHFVAGLVGHGLSAMFALSGFENEAFSSRLQLSDSMGLFLQKTNIIRDYLEDSRETRTFWPHEIWSNYAANLGDFAVRSNRKSALPALNHMVTDALRHVPDCLEYMSFVRDPHVFNFVAIPQVMAIATLSACYNNGKVFEEKVKIRKSLTAKLIIRAQSMNDVYRIFFEQSVAMLHKVETSDPSSSTTRKSLNNIIDICAPHVPPVPDLLIPNWISIVLFCVLSSFILKRRAEHYDGAIFTWRSAGGIMELKDMIAIGLWFIVCIYLFSFFMLPYLTRAQLEEARRMDNARRVADRLQHREGTRSTAPVHFIDS